MKTMTMTTTTMRTRMSSVLAGETVLSPALLVAAGDPFSPAVPPAGSLTYGNTDQDAGDQDTGDLPSGVDEDALDADPLDTDRITATP
jgi:hypothetical protein